MKKQILTSVLLGACVLSGAAQAITLEDYIGEVAAKNGGVRGSKISLNAKELRRTEGTLFFKPSFFLTGEYYDDQRPTNAPAFQGTQTLRHTLRGGLSQNFRTGTKTSLSYNYYKTQINGAGAQFLPNKMFIDVAPMLEVTQSLWRNFLGSEFEAQETLVNAQVEAQKYNEQFRYKQLVIGAENAYWRLFFAQQSLVVQKESLERAKRLRDWNENRVKSNLVDESELLQAEANLQNREMEYQDTLTEVDTAMREFNSYREADGDTTLVAPQEKDSKYILNASLPMKAEVREDVLASLANNKVAIANSEIGTQRNRPNLELYGSYSINGRDPQFTDSQSQAWGATRPFSIVGLRFTTPLDVGSLSDYKKAFAKEVVASEMTYKRKMYEVDREWEILSERFKNLKTRLQLSQRLEKAQERKLTTEKRRYNQGRTTTFQVLQFEQDFANAQLLKLRNERELITVYNQLKMFSGASYAE